MSWWHNDYLQFLINSDLFITCIDPLKHFLKWVNGIPAVFVNLSGKLPSAYSISSSQHGTWTPVGGSIIDHKRKYSIFINACFQNSGHHKNVMSLRVIKNVSCIYFLRPLLDRLWVIVYILHFMVQSPCSVFIVPSHKIWTWCGQNKFCMLLLPLGDSWLKEQVRLDEIRNQFGRWKRNLQAFLCYRIKVSL